MWPFNRKAYSVEMLWRMIQRQVNKDAQVFATRKLFYLQVVLALSPKEFEHYQPFLGELHQALSERLSLWYSARDANAVPRLALQRADKLAVNGCFASEPRAACLVSHPGGSR